jgi:hypothetical protein
MAFASSVRPCSPSVDLRLVGNKRSKVMGERTVLESLQIRERRAKETVRSHLLHVLEIRCGLKAPADIVSAIEDCANPEMLWRWADAAWKVRSYDEFRAVMPSHAGSDSPYGIHSTDEHSDVLKRWGRRVSHQVLAWLAEARAEALRTALLRVLEKRCKAPIPNDLAEIIQVTQDTGLLLRWLDAAAEASTLDEFRAAMRL